MSSSPPCRSPPEGPPLNFVPNWLRYSRMKFQLIWSSPLGPALNTPPRERAFSADPGGFPACPNPNPPVPEIGLKCASFPPLCMRKMFPPVKNSLRGTPEKKSQRGSKIATLSSCSGRAFSAHMTIFDVMIDR